MSERLFSMLANGEIFLYDSSMADQITEPAPTYQRKRWRKTKWFYSIVLMYYAVTIGAAVTWSAYSHRKFNEVVDPIIARGEPLAWSDFATDPIPDDQNAAVLYQQAMLSSPFGEYPSVGSEPFIDNSGHQSASKTRGEVLLAMFEEFEGPPQVFRREYPAEARELLDMSKDILSLCRKARRLDKADWGVDYSGADGWAITSGGHPPCGVQRLKEIAAILSLAAVDAHKSGRDDEAVEYIRDALAMGDSLSKVPDVVTHLMTLAVYSFVTKPLEAILPGIKIGDGAGSVSVGVLDTLRSDLMDTTLCSQGLRLAFMSERSSIYDAGQRMMNMEIPGEGIGPANHSGYYLSVLRSDPIARWSFDFCVAPMWRIDTARAVSRLSRNIRPQREGRTLSEFQRAQPQQVHDCGEHYFPRLLSCMMLPAIDRVVTLNFLALVDRQMAAVAISVRMYQSDHGRLPDTLAQLVPDYLVEVPQDLMAEPGQPIRYVNDPDMPRLYSVGENGQDNGGDHEAFDGDYYARKDKFFFLNGRPARPDDELDQDASGGTDGEN